MEKSKLKAINWKYIWRSSCLALRNDSGKLTRLMDDKVQLQEYGIIGSQRIEFARL